MKNEKLMLIIFESLLPVKNVMKTEGAVTRRLVVIELLSRLKNNFSIWPHLLKILKKDYAFTLILFFLKTTSSNIFLM